MVRYNEAPFDVVTSSRAQPDPAGLGDRAVPHVGRDFVLGAIELSAPEKARAIVSFVDAQSLCEARRSGRE